MKPRCLLTFFAALGLAFAQPSLPATQLRVFTPFNASGLVIGLAVTDQVEGSCFAGSTTTLVRPDAWRCTSGNAILDPCFQDLLGDPKVLACAETPFSADVVLLTLTSELPQPSVQGEPDFDASLPWALELENGQLCTLLTGATAPVAGMRVNYGCADGAQVVGALERTLPMWRVFYQTANRSLSLDQVGVRTAWY